MGSPSSNSDISKSLNEPISSPLFSLFFEASNEESSNDSLFTLSDETSSESDFLPPSNSSSSSSSNPKISNKSSIFSPRSKEYIGDSFSIFGTIFSSIDFSD